MANTTTSNQDEKITKALIDRFDTDFSWLFELIGKIAYPEDIFDDSALQQWALDNGFVKAE